MPKPTRGAQWKPRKCKHCKLIYVPKDKNPANAARSKFCTRKCKDGYHRNGGMNLDRLVEVLMRRLKREIYDAILGPANEGVIQTVVQQEVARLQAHQADSLRSA